MNLQRRLPLLFIITMLLCIPVASYAQLWSTILDPSRATDWTQAGIPGGIPNYTTICATVAPSGLTDATDMNAIDSAIVTCGATAATSGVGQVVQLEAGTYTITGGLIFSDISQVVLRGAGPDQTILAFTGENQCVGEPTDICIAGSSGNVGLYYGAAPWTGDNGVSGTYTKGDTVIDLGTWVKHLSSKTGPAVGDMLILDQRNDSVGICPASGGTGACTGVSGATESASTVTITTSIPHGYSVNDCVGIGNVGGTNSTSAYNSAGNTLGSCGGSTGWFQITAVPSSTTFQYTAPAAGLAATGGGNVTKDTGGVFISDVHGATIDEQVGQGRVCPQSFDPNCATGEVSNRSQMEIKMVTAVNGSQVTITPPLEMNNWRTSQSPGVWYLGTTDTLDGIEDLTYDMTNDGGGTGDAGINFHAAYEGWVKNVRGINPNRNAVWMVDSARIDVVDSYFFGTKKNHTQAYGVEALGSSDDLIQNNICQHAVNCMMVGGAYGSVYGYNYMSDDAYTTQDWMMPMMSANHDLSGMVLFEGNDSPGLHLDNTHGTASNETFLRNRAVGQGTPAASNPSSLYAIKDPSFNRAENFVDNVIGTPSVETTYQDTTNINPSNTIWSLGVQGENGVVTDDPLATSTLLRWGNYDTATGTTRYFTSEVPSTGVTFVNGQFTPSESIPASFYSSTKPGFFTTAWGSPAWPPIGAGVSASGPFDATCSGSPTACDGVGNKSYQIPAQIAFNNSPIDPAYQQTFTVTGASWANTIDHGQIYPGTVTLTIGTHPLVATDTVTVTGVNPAGYNGTFEVDSVGTNTITYYVPTNPGTWVSGGSVSWPNIRLFNAENSYPSDYALVTFSTYSPALDITSGPPAGYTLNASIAPGTGGPPINPLVQSMTLKIGPSYTVTIPAGSFVSGGGGTFTYSGTISSVTYSITITPTGGGAYTIAVSASGVDLTRLANPMHVTLTIGINTGTATVTATY